jgi:hypothetical protein
MPQKIKTNKCGENKIIRNKNNMVKLNRRFTASKAPSMVGFLLGNKNKKCAFNNFTDSNDQY